MKKKIKFTTSVGRVKIIFVHGFSAPQSPDLLAEALKEIFVNSNMNAEQGEHPMHTDITPQK